MKPLIALLRGFNLKHLRIVTFAWTGNLILGVTGAVALYGLLSSYPAAFPAHPEPQLPSLIIRFIDLANNQAVSVQMLLTMMISLALATLILHVFISAGSLAALISAESSNLRRLLRLSAEHFWTFMRMFLPAALLAGFLLILQMALIWLLHELVLSRQAGLPVALSLLFWLLVSLLMAAFFTAVYDLSRIIRLKFGRGTVYSFLEAIRLSWSYRWSLLALYMVYFLGLILFGLLVYMSMTYLNPMLPLVLTIPLSQILAWIRHFLKIWLFSSEIIFFDAIIAEQPEAE